MFVWCRCNSSHKIIGDEGPDHDGALARRTVFDGVPVKVDRYDNDRHLTEAGGRVGCV